MSHPDATLAFKAAVEARDAAAVRACLAPNVRFYAPLRYAPFIGRDEVASILQIPAAVFTFHDSFRYTRVFDDGDHQALFFEAMIEDRSIEGIDLLRLDQNGLVTEIRVMMRPLATIQRFAALAAEILAATQGPEPLHAT
jgi:SnoaL-like domain